MSLPQHDALLKKMVENYKRVRAECVVSDAIKVESDTERVSTRC